MYCALTDPTILTHPRSCFWDVRFTIYYAFVLSDIFMICSGPSIATEYVGWFDPFPAIIED